MIPGLTLPPNDPRRRRSPSNPAQALHDQLGGVEEGIRALKAAGDTSSKRYRHLRDVQSETTQRLLALHASSSPVALNNDVLEGVRRQAERLTGKPVSAPPAFHLVEPGVVHPTVPGARVRDVPAPTATRTKPAGAPRPRDPFVNRLLSPGGLFGSRDDAQTTDSFDPNARANRALADAIGPLPFTPEYSKWQAARAQKTRNDQTAHAKWFRAQANVPLDDEDFRDRPYSRVAYQFALDHDGSGIQNRDGSTTEFAPAMNDLIAGTGKTNAATRRSMSQSDVETEPERRIAREEAHRAHTNFLGRSIDSWKRGDPNPAAALGYGLMQGGLDRLYEGVGNAADVISSGQQRATLNGVTTKEGARLTPGQKSKSMGEYGKRAIAAVGNGAGLAAWAGSAGTAGEAFAHGLSGRAFGADAALSGMRDASVLSDPTSSDEERAQAWNSLGTSTAMFGLPALGHQLPLGKPGSALGRGVREVRATLRKGEEPSNAAARGVRSELITDDKKLQAPDVPWKRDSKYLGRDGKYHDFGSEDLGATDLDGNIVINSKLVREVNGVHVPDNNLIVPAIRHEFVHRFLTPKAGVPKSDLGWWHSRMRDLRWRLYFKNQLGRYAEEAFAQAYGQKSLIKGLKYPLKYSYGLTPWGMVLDAGKLGASAATLTGGTVGAREGLKGLIDYAYDGGQQDVALGLGTTYSAPASSKDHSRAGRDSRSR